jgi:hypothetical protein
MDLDVLGTIEAKFADEKEKLKTEVTLAVLEEFIATLQARVDQLKASS